MTTVGWLPASAEELFGPLATAEESYEVLTVDVPPSSWLTALDTARTTLTCTYFDWLSAVDEPGTGFRVSAHVVALSPVRRLLLRTTVPHESPVLASAVGVYAGAGWHERETHEMFGVRFDGHPALDHLLLPENFEGHPLRKDFVLAARVAKAWPGAKEPGESDHGGPKRRQILPPGVPDPNEWGPLKGQLPPAPARPARAAGRPARAAGATDTGERPARRTRSTPDTPTDGPINATQPPETPPTPRRARSASQGSASQQRPGGEAAESSAEPPPAAAGQAPGAGPAPRRARSASQGSASQQRPGDEEATGAAEPSAPGASVQPTPSSTAPRSSDAPWHHARPAFEAPEPKREPPVPESWATAPDVKRPSAAPAPEAPASETPTSAPPAAETSASGTSASGTPASGTPASGTPASDALASEAPVPETSAPGEPTLGEPTPGETVSEGQLHDDERGAKREDDQGDNDRDNHRNNAPDPDDNDRTGGPQ